MTQKDYADFRKLYAEFHTLKRRLDELGEALPAGTPDDYDRIAHEHGIVSYKLTAHLRRLSVLLTRAQESPHAGEAAACIACLTDARAALRVVRAQARRWRRA